METNVYAKKITHTAVSPNAIAIIAGAQIRRMNDLAAGVGVVGAFAV